MDREKKCLIRKRERVHFFFWRTNWLYHIHGVANFWAELDLNQRRHIANEFTVRPH